MPIKRLAGLRSARNRALALIVIYSLLVFALAWLLFGIRFDDPFITYRYAENIAAGNGFVFNIGEPTLITTAPLYALLLGALRFLGADVPTVSYLIGAASLLAAAFALNQLLARNGQALAGYAAGLCLLGFPLMWLTMGFETPLFIAIALWAFVCVDARRYAWAGVLCGIGMGLRGDGVLVSGIVLLWVFVLEIRDCVLSLSKDWRLEIRDSINQSLISNLRSPISNFLKTFFAAMLLYAPLALWLTTQFGSPLPSTLQTKSAQAVSGLTGFYADTSFLEGALILIRAYANQGGVFIVMLFVMLLGVLLAFGLGITWSQRVRIATPTGLAVGLPALPPDGGPTYLLPILWLLLHGLGYSIIGVAPYVWYYAPLLPGVCVLIGLGLAMVFARTNGAFRTRTHRLAALATRYGLFVAVLLSLLIGNVLVISIVNGGQPPDPSRIESKVLPETKVDVYERVGRWLNANTPLTATIGVTELGVMSYYAQRKTIDFLGLTQPQHLSDIRHGDFLAALLREQPDYLALNHVNAIYDINPQKESWFAKLYRPAAQFEDSRFWGSPMTVWQRIGAPITTPITLNNEAHTLSDGWRVLAIESNTRAVQADAPLRVRVRLQAGQPIGNRTLRLQAEWLEGGDGLPVTSRLIFTNRWRAGEQAWVDFVMLPQKNLKEGAYIISLHWLEGGDEVRAGYLKVQPTPPIVIPPKTEFVALSGDFKVLRFGSFGTSAICNNATIDVPVLWQGGKTNVDYTAFVHLRDASNKTVAQGDGPPKNAGLKYPTSVWATNELVADTHTLQLDGTLAAGKYAIVVGLYNPLDNARMAVAGSAFRSADGGVVVGEIELKNCQ